MILSSLFLGERLVHPVEAASHTDLTAIFLVLFIVAVLYGIEKASECRRQAFWVEHYKRQATKWERFSLDLLENDRLWLTGIMESRPAPSERLPD